MEDEFQQQQQIIVTILDYLPQLKQRIDQVEDFTLSVLKNLTQQVKNLETKLIAVQSAQEKQTLQFENLLLQYANHKLEMKIDQQNTTIQHLESQNSASREREQLSGDFSTQNRATLISPGLASPRLGQADVVNLQSQIDELKRQLAAGGAMQVQTFGELLQSANQGAEVVVEQRSMAPRAQGAQSVPALDAEQPGSKEPSQLTAEASPARAAPGAPEAGKRQAGVLAEFLGQLSAEAASAYDYASKVHAQVALVSLQTNYQLSGILARALMEFFEKHPDAADDAFGFLKTSPYVASPQDAFKRFVTVNNSPLVEIDLPFPINGLFIDEMLQILIPFSTVCSAGFNYCILSNTGMIHSVANDFVYIFDVLEKQGNEMCVYKQLIVNDQTKGEEISLGDAISQISGQIDVIINANHDFDLQILREKQIRHLQLQHKALVNFDSIRLDSVLSLTLLKCYCPNLSQLTSLKSLIISDVPMKENEDDICSAISQNLEYLAIRWSKHVALKIMSKIQTSNYQQQSKLKYLEVYESQLKEEVHVNYPKLQFLVLQYNKQHTNTYINYTNVPNIIYVSVSTDLTESGARPENIHVDSENITQKFQKY